MPNKIISSLLLSSSFLLAACASHPAQEAPEHSTAASSDQTASWLVTHGDWAAVPDPSYSEGELANGMLWSAKVLADNGARDRIELRLKVRVGSLHETDAQLGLAHFVEHMAFNGTERFPKQELISFFEAAGMDFGGDINAYTSFNETVYQLSVPTDNDELLEAAFQVLVDWASAISFDPEEVSKEAPVVVEEWRLRDGSEKKAWLQEFEALYQGTPWANRLPIGDMDVITSATAEDLKAFYQQWYQPQNMEVLVVYPEGSLNPEDLIKEHFSALAKGSSDSVLNIAQKVDIQGAQFGHYTDSEQTRSVWQLSFPSLNVPYNSAEGREYDAYVSIMTMTLASRLQRLGEIDNSPIIDAGAAMQQYEDDQANLTISTTVFDGRETEALQLLATEVKRLHEHGITEHEFKLAIKQTMAQYQNILAWLEGASSADHMSILLYFLDQGYPIEDLTLATAEIEAMGKAIPVSAINQGIKHAFNPQNVWASFYHPSTVQPQVDAWSEVYSVAVASSTDAIIDKVVEQVQGAYQSPGEIVQQADLLADEGLYLWIAENGLAVILKPSELEPGYVSMETFVIGGNYNLDEELLGAAELWAEARVRSGFSGQSGQDFFDMLSAEGLSYDPYISSGTSGVAVSAQNSNLDKMFELTNATFTELSFNERMVSLTKDSNIQNLQQFMATPDYDYWQAYLPALYSDDVRSLIVSVETLQQVDIAQLQAVQSALLQFNSGAFTVIVGDTTPEQVEPLVKAYLAGLSLEAPQDYRFGAGVLKESQKLVIDTLKEQRVDVGYSYSVTELEVTAQSKLLSSVVREMLDKRLRESLREDSGLTYGVGVSTSAANRGERQWLLQISFSTDPDKQDEAQQQLDLLLQTIRSEGFSTKEFNEARLRLQENIKQNYNTNDGQMSMIVEAMFANMMFTEYDNLDPILESLDVDQANELYQLWMQGQQLIALHRPE